MLEHLETFFSNEETQRLACFLCFIVTLFIWCVVKPLCFKWSDHRKYQRDLAERLAAVDLEYDTLEKIVTRLFSQHSAVKFRNGEDQYYAIMCRLATDELMRGREYDLAGICCIRLIKAFNEGMGMSVFMELVKQDFDQRHHLSPSARLKERDREKLITYKLKEMRSK